MNGELLRLGEDGAEVLGVCDQVDLVAVAVRGPASRRGVDLNGVKGAWDERRENLLVRRERVLAAGEVSWLVATTAGPARRTWLTSTIVKLAASVDTFVHETVFWPSFTKPVALVGAVTE